MFVIRYLFDLDNKKTWTLFVYVLEVSPNTLAAYSSKSPRRTDVSILTFTLAALLFWRNFKNKIQADASLSICFSPFCLFYRLYTIED